MADITRITDRLWTGGALPAEDDAFAVDLAAWRAEGITHVIDNRLERSERERIALAAPEIAYLENGVRDAGRRMPDEWFERGVTFALEALRQAGTGVLSHCHVGVNRGPSMAYAIMLALGSDPVDALEAIRRARPFVGLGYADDAVDWWLRCRRVPGAERLHQRTRVVEWKVEHHLDEAAAVGRLLGEHR